MIGTTRLRQARLNDASMIQLLHEEQNERDGTNYPLPDLFAGEKVSKVPVVLAVEHSDEGMIGSLYVDTAPELCFAGCDPRATAVARRDIEALAYMLMQMGFTHLRCLVPKGEVDSIRRPLERAGFKERDDLVIFSRQLRQAQGDDEGGVE
jgi:hypothetical protein